MMTLHSYFNPVDEESTRIILKQYHKTKEDVKRDVEALKIWLKSQHHLPNVLDDRQIRGFLLMCYGSIEKVKQKIDKYFTMRSVFPAIFEDSHPFSERMRTVTKFMYIIPLPRLNYDYSRVVLLKIKDVADPGNVDPVACLAFLINIAEVRLLEDVCYGHTVILDLEHCKIAHCAQISPSFIRNAHYIGEKALTTKVQGFHFLNAPGYFEPVLFLIKSMTKPKLADKITLHTNVNTLFDYVNIDILPNDYKGNEVSLDQLQERFGRKFEEYKDFFDSRETFKVKEDLRPAANVNDDVLGYHGNFKKIDID